MKDRVDHIAAEIGISSSAVWKILLHRSVKPLMDGGSFEALDLFNLPGGRSLDVKDGKADARRAPRDNSPR